MPLRDADLSATPIDDGSMTTTDPSLPRAPNPNDRSNLPRSPQPKLVLFDPRSGQQETIELGGSASSILTLEDYKRLNRRTTERGMITGLVGGGVLTYLVKRFLPKTPSRNALSLTFLFSSAFISYSTSRALLISEILQIRQKAKSNALINGEMSDNAPPSDSMFSGSNGDIFNGTGTSPREFQSPENEARAQSSGRYVPPRYNTNRDQPYSPSPDINSVEGRMGERLGDRGNVREELSRLGNKLPQRTRYQKGKGLEGEVEEENEMRDPYATAGQPRLG